MHNPGKLIVLEGPDGSGKTTLANAITRTLQLDRLEIEVFSFPGREKGTLGEHVYRLHHNSSSCGINTLTETSLQALHVAAHIDVIESKIVPAIQSGKSIILDRFWWSTWVYGLVRGANRKALTAMIAVERLIWGEIKPSVVFLIRRQCPKDTCISEWKRMSEEYAKLAEAEAQRYSVEVIDNEVSIAASVSNILRHDVFPSQNGSTTSRKSESHENNQYQLYLETSRQPKSLAEGAPAVFSKLAPAKPTIVFDTYWKFAAERQEIFFRRARGNKPPWTQDVILQDHKFTNAYRASDRVSQYLIRHVIYEGPQSIDEIVFRTLLFKIFNRIGTWELLVKEIGQVSFETYSFEKYDSVLTAAMDAGQRLYSAAYIMPSGGGGAKFPRKHRMHLSLLERMIRDGLPERLADAASMSKAFDLLRGYPTLGDFLAYQYVTDLNYSNIVNFSEMEFAVAGPGAREGVQKCFSDRGGLNDSDIIRMVTDRQEEEFSRLGLAFQSLWGRPLQLIDCQNIFCEVAKYARLAHPEFTALTGRVRIKQKFRPTLKPIQYWYPPKWGLNKRVPKGGF